MRSKLALPPLRNVLSELNANCIYIGMQFFINARSFNLKLIALTGEKFHFFNLRAQHYRCYFRACLSSRRSIRATATSTAQKPINLDIPATLTDNN